MHARRGGERCGERGRARAARGKLVHTSPSKSLPTKCTVRRSRRRKRTQSALRQVPCQSAGAQHNGVRSEGAAPPAAGALHAPRPLPSTTRAATTTGARARRGQERGVRCTRCVGALTNISLPGPDAGGGAQPSVGATASAAPGFDSTAGTGRAEEGRTPGAGCTGTAARARVAAAADPTSPALDLRAQVGGRGRCKRLHAMVVAVQFYFL